MDPKLSPTNVVDYLQKRLIPAYRAERKRLDVIDRWLRFDHDKPHAARLANDEVKQLASRSQTPWGELVVSSVVQAMYVDGYRSPDAEEDAAPWSWWQANGMDRRQLAVHHATIAYGYSYGTALSGKDPISGERLPVMRGVSPRRMFAVYDEPEYDDWPQFALQVDPKRVKGENGWRLRFFDDRHVYELESKVDGDAMSMLGVSEHGATVCPVVKFTNKFDLEARADGEIERFIPLYGRIDQTEFDRLVVQRFAAFVVRYAKGVGPPEELDDESKDEWRRRTAVQLKVGDVLTVDDAEGDIGALPASPLDGFIASQELNLRVLAAVSQTPAHEMLGQLANLNAEALAAARASASAKLEQTQTSVGETHEQWLRLGAHIMGDVDASRDVRSQVRWRDTSIRSLAQAADALGKLATMLGFPFEVLWEKIPGLTEQDIERAKKIAEKGGGLEGMLRDLLAAEAPPDDAAA